MANNNENRPMGRVALVEDVNQEQNANDDNQNQIQPAFEFQVNGPIAEDEDIGGISDADARAIALFFKNEMLIPLKLTALTLAAFWSIAIHGSLFIFFTLASIFFVLSIVTVREVIPGPHPAIATRSVFQLIEIRAIQLFMMYLQLLVIHLLSWLTLPFIYFRNFAKLREQVLEFFSGTGKESYVSVPWSVYIRISNQLFWLSFIWMVTARTISNLFVMCRIPSFRLLMRYEAEALLTAIGTVWVGVVLFNVVAGPMAGFTPVSVFLLLSLLAWMIFTHLRSTIFKMELEIPRGMDVHGYLRVMNVMMSQLMVEGVLHSLLHLIVYVTIETLSIPISKAVPENSIAKYLHTVRESKSNSSPYEGRNVIELNLNLLVMISTHAITARLFKHRADINKLDTVLEHLMRD